MIGKLLIAAALAAVLGPAALGQARFTATMSGPTDKAMVGHSDDVILIPGLASSGAVWDETVKQLAPSHRVHVLQVRGFAGEPAGANASGPILAPLVEEVAAYAANLKHPAIIGHSLGGLVALEVAAKAPEAVSRIMVVDAAPFYGLLAGGPNATSAGIKAMTAPMREQMMSLDDATFAQAQDQQMRSLVKSDAKRAAPLTWSIQSDRAVVVEAMLEDLAEDARPLLPLITAKTTVLYAWDASAMAQGMPAAKADALFISLYAPLKGAKVKRIDNTFHFIMLDQPQVFAEEVAAFLK